MDTTATLLKSAKHFLGGTLLCRITGVLRDIAMAYTFGAQSSIAAFLVAYRFAHLFRRVLGEGALHSVFIPKFEELRKNDPPRACRYFADLYAGLFLILVGIIALTLCGLGALLFFSKLSKSNREITSLTFLMMPSLLFICLFGLNSAILQCEKYFFIPSIAPAFFNLTWIAATLLISICKPHNPTACLAVTIIAASIIQWGVTIPKMRQVLKSYGQTQVWQRFFHATDDLRWMAKPFLLGVLGIAGTQINHALDPIFARCAQSEGPAYLWYAMRILQAPIALFAISLSGALLPPLSRAAKASDWAKYGQLLRFAIKRCLWVMTPSMLGLLFFGRTAIVLLLGRGQFKAEAVEATAKCLFAYATGLIPMGLVLVISQAFFSRKNFIVPTAASCTAVIINLGMNALMVFGLRNGPASVALATSVSAWVNFLILSFWLYRSASPSTTAPHSLVKLKPL